jgi:hypothetical protein
MTHERLKAHRHGLVDQHCRTPWQDRQDDQRRDAGRISGFKGGAALFRHLLFPGGCSSTRVIRTGSRPTAFCYERQPDSLTLASREVIRDRESQVRIRLTAGGRALRTFLTGRDARRSGRNPVRRLPDRAKPQPDATARCNRRSWDHLVGAVRGKGLPACRRDLTQQFNMTTSMGRLTMTDGWTRSTPAQRLLIHEFGIRTRKSGSHRTQRWRGMDSNLYGAFPSQAVVLGLLPVLCSERESRSPSRRL